jgi:uncharacterized membrane protein YagU involved in acid resistance
MTVISSRASRFLLPLRIEGVTENHLNGTIERCLLGGICGAVATVPMTVLMRVLHRKLPKSEQYPLPPRLITMNVASRAGIASELDESERFTLTMVAHYGYGFAGGVLYSVCLPGSNSITRGIVYGLAIWTVSYLGLLPAFGLFRPATQQPFRRNALMIAAHVVWGAAFGLLQRAVRQGKRQS